MVLLQLWAWERLPLLRPESIIPHQNFHGLPSGARWVSPQFWGDVPNHVIRTYRDQLDRVNQQMFVFEPYTTLLPELPDYCTAGQAIWTARVPLIFFYIVENYYPDRLCMQFSCIQDVPIQVQYSEELHALNGRSGNCDWAEKHAEYLYF
nr:serine/threonine-protein phosphatase 7 long form homolog [Ipomoea batatas]